MLATLHALPPSCDDALHRALAAAATVSGVLAELPCHFHVVPDHAGCWVVVAAPPPRDAGHAVYVRERSLTAVQRLTLSLWSEGVAAVWEPAPLLAPRDAAGLDRLGIDGRDLLGRIWCPDDAAPEATAAGA